MSYHLRFALTLDWQGSQVFYDPKEFVDKEPVVISVPEVEELVKRFVKNLEPVAVVERETTRNPQDSKELKAGSNRTDLSDNNLSSENKAGQTTVLPRLRVVEAQAYVCKAKELESSLECLCSETTAYLSKTFSTISGADFLSDELNALFAGIRQVSDLRNYLLTFVKNPKKMYREGYIYVMVV